MRKFLIISFLIFFPSLAIAGESSAPAVICTFIEIFSGRIARAICILVMMGMAFLCFNGSITWQKASTVIGGFALIFGAKTFAVLLLSSNITGVSGLVGNKVFYKEQKYTPEEIINAACPSI